MLLNVGPIYFDMVNKLFASYLLKKDESKVINKITHIAENKFLFFIFRINNNEK